MSLPKGWANHIRRVKEFEGLGQDETDEVVAALEYFRDRLGANFRLDEHPIRHYLLLRSVSSLHFLTWLADELRWLAEKPGGMQFFKKLKDPGAFHPTVAEIETAARLREAGCGFDLEPEVKIRGNTKRPDFRTHGVDGIPPCYVEVKYKRLSKTTERNEETAFRVRIPRSPFSGVCYRAMAPGRLDRLNEEICNLEQKAQQTGELQVLHRSNVIRLAVGPVGSEREIAKWAEKHSLELNTLSGPVDDTNEVVRVKSAVMRKKGQLPDDYPAIIAIKNPSVFRDETTVFEALIKIEEEMHRIPNLAFVLIHGIGLNNNTPLYKYRRPAHSFAMSYHDHVYAEYFSKRHFMVDRVIVLRNRYGMFDNLFGLHAGSRLAQSILTGYKPRPLPEVEIELMEEEFKRRFTG